MVDLGRRYRNVFVDLGDGGKVKDLPFVGLVGDEAGEIVHVDALHDNDDRASPLVVKAGQQRILEPFVGRVALGLGIGVVRLQRIVNDDDVAAAPSQGAAD